MSGDTGMKRDTGWEDLTERVHMIRQVQLRDGETLLCDIHQLRGSGEAYSFRVDYGGNELKGSYMKGYTASLDAAKSAVQAFLEAVGDR